MRLLFCGTGFLPIVDFIRARLPAGATIGIRDPTRPIEDELRAAQVLVPGSMVIDAAAIAVPVDLRLVQQSATGYDHIDLDAARARGVPVCNVPGLNADAVAELALYLILALARRVRTAARDFEQGHVGVPLGRELKGKILGIVGLGRSGSALATRAVALGMEVVSVRSQRGPDALTALLARADVVSLHCPLTPATRGLLDDGAFACMKPGAFLVNCARAAIVDRGALERALASNRLGGFGLDVHWQEPWNPADPLYAREDVVALPHVGSSTEEAFAALAAVVAENVRRLGVGEPLLYRLV